MNSYTKFDSDRDGHVRELRMFGRSVRSEVRRASCTALAVGGLAFPLALTTGLPATASTTVSGCTVRPLRPVAQLWVDVNQQFETRIKYSTEITCPRDRIVQIQDQRYEQDDPPAGITGDEYHGQTVATRSFASSATVTVDAWRRLIELNTEAGSEELYHRVRFRVATINGVSAWTAYESSAVFSTSGSV